MLPKPVRKEAIVVCLVKGIKLNNENPPAKSVYWMTTIYLQKSKKRLLANNLAKKLKQKLIDTRPVFPSISTYPMWKTKNNYFSKEFSKHSLNLPSGHNLSKQKVKYISNSIINIINKNEKN